MCPLDDEEKQLAKWIGKDRLNLEDPDEIIQSSRDEGFSTACESLKKYVLGKIQDYLERYPNQSSSKIASVESLKDLQPQIDELKKHHEKQDFKPDDACSDKKNNPSDLYQKIIICAGVAEEIETALSKVKEDPKAIWYGLRR